MFADGCTLSDVVIVTYVVDCAVVSVVVSFAVTSFVPLFYCMVVCVAGVRVVTFVVF